MERNFKRGFLLRGPFVLMLLALGVFSCSKEDFTPEASNNLKNAPGRNSYASSGMPGILYFSTNSKVVALNATDGTLVWQKTGAFYPSISPVVANGRVHVLNQSGTMKTFTQQTGNLLWESADVPNNFEYEPVVANGIVHFISESPTVVAHALNATTGKPVWSKFIDNIESVSGGSAVAEGLTYHTSMSKLNALNANTGAVEWTVQDFEANGSFGAPTIHNKILYISQPQRLYAIDAINPGLKWSKKYDKYLHMGPPVYANGALYCAPRVSLEGYFAAFSATDGAEQWSLKLDGYSLSSPTIFVGTAYIVTNTNKLYAIDLQGKKIKWSITLPVSPYKGPVVQWQVTGNAVLYVSGIGKLCAFNAWTGTKLWEYNTPGEWPSRVALIPPISNTIYSVEYPTESGMRQ